MRLALASITAAMRPNGTRSQLGVRDPAPGRHRSRIIARKRAHVQLLEREFGGLFVVQQRAAEIEQDDMDGRHKDLLT